MMAWLETTKGKVTTSKDVFQKNNGQSAANLHSKSIKFMGGEGSETVREGVVI